MKRGLLARRSRAADWCWLLGALALPVLTIGALGVRAGFVPAPALIPVIATGLALGLLATALGGFAVTEIWLTGAEGAGSAAAGILYAFPVIVILAGIAAASVIYPRLTDVSTDPDEPLFLVQPADRAADVPERQDDPGRARYADIGPRLYALPVAAVYGAVRELVADRGWEIVAEGPPASDPGGSAGPAAALPSDSRPAANPDSGTLQAIARTPIFRFADDVVVRVRKVPEGTRVDMRSASRLGRHDLGQNARRIRGFLAALDVALQPDPGAPASAGPVIATPSPAAPEPVSR